MKSVLTAIFVLVLLVPLTQAQLVSDAPAQPEQQSMAPLGVEPVRSPFSLFDLSRISWSHSYSVSFFSGGIGSGSAGLWSSVMHYDLHDNLSLSVNLAVSHNSGAMWGDGSTDAQFLPGFRLDYHPSEKFRMIIDFQQVDGRTAYMRGSPYYHSPYYPAYWGR